LRQFRGECALWRSLFDGFGAFSLGFAALPSIWSGTGLSFGFGWLGGVGAKQPVFERGAIETPDDRLHLVGRGGFHEGESFGFLLLAIAAGFDRIGNGGL